MTSAFGRVERGIIERKIVAGLRASEYTGLPTSTLAKLVFGEEPTTSQKASVARAVRSLTHKGVVVVLPPNAARRRRQVQLVQDDNPPMTPKGPAPLTS